MAMRALQQVWPGMNEMQDGQRAIEMCLEYSDMKKLFMSFKTKYFLILQLVLLSFRHKNILII